MNILVLGSTGMLGNAVGNYFLNTGHKVYLTYRNKELSYGDNNLYFDPLVSNIDKIINDNDIEWCINCIGVIKPFMSKDIIGSRLINSVFPHQLSESCLKNNVKLLHITTDCVFSGRDGKYNEDSFHDALDDYGKSKSLGEPKNTMTIRTSIIGEEIHNKVSLIEWVKSQKGKTVNGFTNHYWNGITTNQYAVLCNKIINDNLYKPGIFHVHSGDVSKYEMLKIINNKYDLNLTINQFEDRNSIDRTLRTKFTLNEKLNVPSVEDMINTI